MPMLGPWELIVILVIVVVIFGAGRLSEVGGALGKSVREFRRATTDERHPDASPTTTTTTTPQTSAPAQPAPSLAATPIPSTPTQPAAAAAADVICPSCAHVNRASQTFCGQCGTRLIRAA